VGRPGWRLNSSMAAMMRSLSSLVWIATRMWPGIPERVSSGEESLDEIEPGAVVLGVKVNSEAADGLARPAKPCLLGDVVRNDCPRSADRRNGPDRRRPEILRNSDEFAAAWRSLTRV